MKTRIKIYYSIEDNFPPYRVDVSVLFGNYLSKLAVDIEWYMRRASIKHRVLEEHCGQKVHLPFYIVSKGVLAKVFNKISFWFCDIWQLIRCLSKKIDVIQVRDKYIAGLAGLLIARLKGIPFVYWCSYPFPEHYLELAKTTSGLRRIYCYFNGSVGFFILYKIVIPLSFHTFVQSEQMKWNMVSYGVETDKMTPVPMGVPDRIFSLQKNAVSMVNAQHIVYIGTLASIRRMHVLIEAFAIVVERLPEAKFVLVGDGDIPSERLDLQKLTQELGLDNAVEFTGFLPIDEAWQIAATSQCCVSPIYPTPVLNVGSPTKLVEYMALGRPVICNNHPEQSKIISQSGAGLCVEWDVNAFADAMIWMLEHSDQAEAMGAKGPDWVKENRTYSVIANNVMQKYQEILGAGL